jgi:hypothetical protein
MTTRNARVRIPFATKSTEIAYAAISDDKGSTVYLLKRGDICPAEDPEELQFRVRQKSRSTALYFKAVEAFKEANQCTHKEARDEFLSVGAKGDLYEWLSADDIAELIELESSAKDVSYHVATLFLQLRLLHPIVISGLCPEGSNILQVEPLNTLLHRGDVIRIDRQRVVVTADADYDDQRIQVEAIKADLVVGTVGFLMDGRSEKVGSPDWTIEDTRAYLTGSQIETIYAFYIEEDSARYPALPEAESMDLIEGNPEKSLPPSSDMLPATPSTGRRSIGASKATGSETIDSTEKVLVSSPAG